MGKIGRIQTFEKGGAWIVYETICLVRPYPQRLTELLTQDELAIYTGENPVWHGQIGYVEAVLDDRARIVYPIYVTTPAYWHPLESLQIYEPTGVAVYAQPEIPESGIEDVESPTDNPSYWVAWKQWGDRWHYTGTVTINRDRVALNKGAQWFPAGIDPNQLTEDDDESGRSDRVEGCVEESDLPRDDHSSTPANPEPTSGERGVYRARSIISNARTLSIDNNSDRADGENHHPEPLAEHSAPCQHDRAIPGLDGCYCPGCGVTQGRRSLTFNRIRHGWIIQDGWAIDQQGNPLFDVKNWNDKMAELYV